MLFTFPSRYLFTIGHIRVFRLGGWSPHVQTEFHVFRPTRITLNKISHTGLSPCVVTLSRVFCYLNKCFRAGPRSLAATWGISVDFFSSGYLDVSVLQVSLPYRDILNKDGFSHSEIHGSKRVYSLPVAYRKLLRPSSPSTA